MNLKYLILCCVAALLVLPAVAQDSEGADTYKAKCLMCHGPDGTAQTPAGKVFKAASFRDPVVVKTPDDELASIVKKGKNKMPVFGSMLSDDQIKSVIAYIHTLQKD
ncbi:MAG TPA: cytochrome c [Acidobacteriaceae bacterium]|jgi:mono/diheme cytochrome c family protein